MLAIVIAHGSLSRRGTAAALVVVAVAACSTAASGDATDAGSEDAIPDASPEFADVVRDDPLASDASDAVKVDFVLGGCLGIEGCHVSGAAGLTFPQGDRAELLVGVASTERPELLRVRPFDPERSYVVLKLRGDGGIEGGRMPLDGLYDPRVPELFTRWVEAGAPRP